MEFFTDSYGNINMAAVLMAAVIIIGIFLLSRWINLWYWKINDFKKDQEEQIRLLRKIAGEPESDIEEKK